MHLIFIDCVKPSYLRLSVNSVFAEDILCFEIIVNFIKLLETEFSYFTYVLIEIAF